MRKRGRVVAAKGVTATKPNQIIMKNILSYILTILLVALLISPPGAIATDLTYTTLPQDTDSALILSNKRATESASNKFTYISTATTTAVKATSGVLEKIIVGTVGSSSTVTIYDNTAGSGTVIGVINSDSLGTYHFGGRFGTGLTIVTVGTPKVTVVYR